MATDENAVPTVPHTSLYVGDLAPTVDEQELIERFGKVGSIYHVRVCRDISTKYSLGYAYVNFIDPKDAERALELMNYEIIHNRPIRLMWSQRDPALRKSGKGNIFIKNLAKEISQKELYDTFGCFGPILSCKIAVDENGNSKGFGYVHFEDEDHATKAIAKINGMSILNQIVYVGPFIPRSTRKSGTAKQRFNNVYVKSFPPETNDESLREMFEEFGEIISCCVSVDAEGNSKGFGFVCFKDPDSAEKAAEALHGKEINGRQLYVNRAQKKEERQEELKQRLEKQRADRQSKYARGVNLYVKNLDDNVDDQTLESAFSRHGSITSAKVMRDASGRSKGFGFVCFSQPEEATRAICEMHTFMLGSKPLYVALAQRKDERRLLMNDLTRFPQPRVGMAPIMPPPNPNYLQQTAFPRAPPYFPQGMMSNQPRWYRPSQLPAQLNPLSMARQLVGQQYMNPGATPQMAQMAQLRAPTGNVARPMMPNGGMPSSAAMVNGTGMIQNQPRRPPPGSTMTQLAANGMQQSAAGAMQRMGQPHTAAVANQQAGRQLPFQYNQVTRQLNPAAMMNAPVSGDQMAMRMAAVGQQQQALANSPKPRNLELGACLLPRVTELEPTRASKITGMLLGLKEPEIMQLLQSTDALKAKVEEACSLLDNQANGQTDSGSGTVMSSNAQHNRGDVNGGGQLAAEEVAAT